MPHLLCHLSPPVSPVTPPSSHCPAALLLGFGVPFFAAVPPLSFPGQHLGFLRAWSTPLWETVPRPEETVLCVSIIFGANVGVLKSRNTQ